MLVEVGETMEKRTQLTNKTVSYTHLDVYKRQTRGAVVGGFVGLALAVILTIGSASVWEHVLHNPKGSAWFPYNSAAIFSMSAAFFTIWLVSILDNSAQAKKERALFPAQQLRSETGLGAAGASGH